MALDSKIRCQKNGPYQADGVKQVTDADGQSLSQKPTRYLCRCGHTAYPPFCDGSHIDIGFRSDDEGASPQALENLPSEESAQPTIEIVKNGPYKATAIALEINDSVQQEGTGTYTLCRCGHSSSKPFCDGSHQATGFKDDGRLPIVRIDDISDELTRVTIAKKELVVVKVGNELSVFSGVCLHAEALLADGFIEENYLTCGRHRWRYHLETGELDGDPETKLKKLDSSVEQGWLYVNRKALDDLSVIDDD